MMDKKAERMVCQTFNEWKDEKVIGHNHRRSEKMRDIKDDCHKIEKLKAEIMTLREANKDARKWLQENKKADRSPEKYAEWVSKV